MVSLKHLTEVAVKATSPSINDPATAVQVLDYLTQLLLYRAALQPFNALECDKNHLFFRLVPLSQLKNVMYLEMYNYMKNDPVLVKKMKENFQILQKESMQKIPGIHQLFQQDQL